MAHRFRCESLTLYEGRHCGPHRCARLWRLPEVIDDAAVVAATDVSSVLGWSRPFRAAAARRSLEAHRRTDRKVR